MIQHSSGGHYTPLLNSCSQQQQPDFNKPGVAVAACSDIGTGIGSQSSNQRVKTTTGGSIGGGTSVVGMGPHKESAGAFAGVSCTGSGSAGVSGSRQHTDFNKSTLTTAAAGSHICGKGSGSGSESQQPFQLHSRLDVERIQSSFGLSSSCENSNTSANAPGTSNNLNNIATNANCIVVGNSSTSAIQHNSNKGSNNNSITGKCFIKNPAVNKASCKSNKYQSNCSNFVVTKNATSTSTTTDSSNNSTSNSNSGKKVKMVAAQELNESSANNSFEFDPSEELQYGPGIVSKLRCRYLSLALRQSATKQRPSLDILRRATSLNNLLDDDEASHSSGVVERSHYPHNNSHSHNNGDHGSCKSAFITAGCRTPDEFVATFQKNVKQSDRDKSHQPMHQHQYQPRSRQTQRGNDSLKRARSVEALLVCDNKSSWDPENTTTGTVVVQLRQKYLQHKPPAQLPPSPPPPPPATSSSSSSPTVIAKQDCSFNGQQFHIQNQNQLELISISSASDVTIEDKISNARERLSLTTENKPPKRLTSFMDETERPPPDVVKQTLKIFEASANRRGRGLSRNNFSGEVAAKVANYKSIISQEKPPIVFPKPPLSPKKTNFRSKPASLDIAAAKKYSNGGGQPSSGCGSKITSPVSNLAKKFTGNSDTDEIKEKLSPQQCPPSPISVQNAELAFRHGSKNESTPIRNTFESRTPDIIPRKNFDTSLLATNSTDSPVTQITKKIERLTIESPPPQLQSQAGTSSNSTLTCPQIQRKLQTESMADSLDGEVMVVAAKRVSKLALENISKAGTTQEFSFTNPTTTSKTTTLSSAAGSSLLMPGGSVAAVAALVNGTSTTTATTTSSSPSSSTSSSSSNSNGCAMESQIQQPQVAKQVGVIRPLLVEPKIIPTEDKEKTALSTDISVDELSAKSRDKLVITNLNQSAIPANRTSPQPTPMPAPGGDRPTLTSREIEKNLINEKKNELANKETSNGSGKWHFSKKKTKSQAPTQPAQNNSMVFNFKDRKEVPDYIENDGLIFKRKRDLPKPNESGFVLLGEISLETSTDPADDSWDMGPPSPCDVEFENANIIIDGKSSIRFRSKDLSLRVQFDDTLTSTFEYPSESSLLDDSTTAAVLAASDNNATTAPIMPAAATTANESTNPAGHVSVDGIVKNPGQKLLGNMTLGSAPLGSYTPVKAQIQTNFELGVTRAPSNNAGCLTNTNGNSTSSVTGNNCNVNGSGGGGTTMQNGSSANEPESLQYLKPATDDLTVVYSEGTQKTDLLY